MFSERFTKNLDTYADVVFAIPFTQLFTYRIPDELRGYIQPGVRVVALFGHRKTTGYVVGLKNTTDLQESELKQISEVLDPKPVFTPEMMNLTRWIADYYLCGWGEVLKAALPAGLHREARRSYFLNQENPAELVAELSKKAPKQAAIIQTIIDHSPCTLEQLQNLTNIKNIQTILKTLVQKDYLKFELVMPASGARIKYENYFRLSTKITSDDYNKVITGDDGTLTPNQLAALQLIYEQGEISRKELFNKTRCTTQSMKRLLNLGLAEMRQQEEIRDYYKDRTIEKPKYLVLNADQQQVLETIFSALAENKFATFLLHGVTGSGKTQVYIEAIYKVLACNKTAIVLVPEISLTPQTVSRFKAHFGTDVAVMHSRMSEGERFDSWRRIHEKQARVIIGPRSVIFAPLANIGLIVIDEEHEHSYKQDKSPRYNARDVAVMRAKLNEAIVLLGSATPSIESYFNVNVGKYKLLELPNRIEDIEMPNVSLVDMRKERITGRKDIPVFSRLLRKKIDEKLARGEQVILLQNRRGFATFIKCHDCNYVAMCENCDISLTFHLPGRFLRCHYCDYKRPAPEKCPNCGGTDIYLRGIGTQKVEEELKQLFPGVKSIRMDLDTTRGKYAHDRILDGFGQGQYEVLLGTQMVAKGLDFPRVTLVGVISADTELLLPDFRSAERTFQLITQVAGRAGRKERQGEVIVQTYSPDNITLLCAQKHDYQSFYHRNVLERRILLYPPFGRMIVVSFQSPKLEDADRAANLFATYLPKLEEFDILGPAPSPLSKLQGKYRYQIILRASKIKDPGSKKMRAAVMSASWQFKTKHRIKELRISVDVDPITIL